MIRNALLALALTGTLSLRISGVIPSTGYSSYLGGGGGNYNEDQGQDIAVDQNGSAYIAGNSNSEPFPAGQNYGPPSSGGFVTKVNPAGTAVEYSTYFSSIEVHGVALNAAGEAYVLAQVFASSADYFPLETHGGGYTDAGLIKLDAAGNLLFARLIGGSDLEIARGIALDSEGNVYISGITTSTDFPTTAGAAQPTVGGGFDGFVVKFNPIGDVVYASYFGGDAGETVLNLAVDSQGRAHLCGAIRSSSVPGVSSIQSFGPATDTDAYVARFNPAGTAVEWVGRVGGTGTDAAANVAVAADGSVVLFGQTSSADFHLVNPLKNEFEGTTEQFVTKFSADGLSLVFSTLFGGPGSDDMRDYQWVGRYFLNGEERGDQPLFTEVGGLALDSAGNIHLAARTDDGNWPFLGSVPAGGGSWDGYIVRLNPTGTAVLDVHFLSSVNFDVLRSLALDGDGNAYVTGGSDRPLRAPYFVTTPGAFQDVFGGSVSDAIVIKVPAGEPPLLNDHFASRPLIRGTRATVHSNSENASREGGEPVVPGEFASKTVWWRWVAPANGKLIASTRGTPFEAVLQVFTGSAFGDLVSTGENQDDPGGWSLVTLPVTAGTEYQIRVHGLTPDGGDIYLSLTFSEPENDDFANAITLTGFPASGVGSNRNGTFEPFEEMLELGVGMSSWWKWTPALDVNVAVSTLGSSFNTILAVYQGAGIEDLVVVAQNDNTDDPAGTSEISFQAEAGQPYYISVFGPYDLAGDIQLNLVPNSPPANDDFANAAVLTGTSTNVTATNIRATREPLEPDLIFTGGNGQGNADSAGNTVWWTWTSPASGRLKINTIGSNFDTRLGIFTGGPLPALNLVASHNDINLSEGRQASAVDFDAVENTTYHILVDGSIYSQAGVIQLALRLSFPPRIDRASLVELESGALRFQVTAVPDARYQLERSTTLPAWDREPEIYTGPDFQITTPSPTGPREFFRLVEIP